MGSPSFAVPSLGALAEAGHRVVGVYSQPDRPAGRGRRLTPPAVKVWAEAHGLLVLQPPTLRSPDALAKLRELAPEIIVVAAYGKILPESVLAVPPRGVLNVHPSMLPKYRGAAPIVSAMLAGETATGITIMLVDAGMDSGPILEQRPSPISPEDTADSLERRLAAEGAALLVETVGRWLRGEITPRPQDPSRATYARKLAKEDGEIRWALSAEEIARQVRALNPWPGTYTTWKGAGLKVLQARQGQFSEPGASEPGRVVLATGSQVAVGTGAGLLLLEQVQLEGRQQMTARELVAGRHDFVGSRLPS